MGSNFAAGLMASLLYSASKERVGLGVALLAFVGLLRHAEPDSLDAEVNVEALGVRPDSVCVCVYMCPSVHFSSPVGCVGWPCTRAPSPLASADWSACTAAWRGWPPRPQCPAPPPSCELWHTKVPADHTPSTHRTMHTSEWRSPCGSLLTARLPCSERTPQLAKALGLLSSPRATPCVGASLAEVLFPWLPLAGRRTVGDMFRAFLSQVYPATHYVLVCLCVGVGGGGGGCACVLVCGGGCACVLVCGCGWVCACADGGVVRGLP